MIRVLLVVDVPFYRDGLHRLLSQDGEIAVTGAVAGTEAVACATAAPPDLVLLDIRMPQAREWLTQMRALTPAPRVIALAVDDAEESVIDWLAAGIAGYVSKYSSYSELIQILRAAACGEWTCSPKGMALVLRRLTALSAHAPAASVPVPSLTFRERQILELVAKGLSNKRIAIALRISHATAKNHVHHILNKLQLRNRAEVAAHLNRLPRAPGATQDAPVPELEPDR